MIHIISQYFKINNNENDENYELLTKRQNEYTYCLKKNLEYEYIEKIHLLLEKENDLQELINNKININNNKLNIINFNKRMYYKDAFEYANQYLENKIVVLLHSDIYLESGFDKIKNMKNKMYPLARTSNIDGKNTGRGIRIYNIKDKGDFCVSFDGFCFSPPIKKDIITNSNHPQNTWGGENKIIYLFKKNKYHVFTPNSFKIIHWHITDLRPWTKNQNYWVTIDNRFVEHESKEYWKWRKNKNIVGGGIPLELGSSKMVNHL